MAIKNRMPAAGGAGPVKIQTGKGPQVNVDFMKIWATINQYIPQILMDPVRLLNRTLHFTNLFFTLLLFMIILGQTIYILSGSQRKYINIRHIGIKWLTLLITLQVSDYIKEHTAHAQIFVFLCNIFALSMVYPSSFIKNLHLKYFNFSQKKRNQDISDQLSHDISLTTRILQSITIFFLNTSRFLITFIHPRHRKKIQVAMKGVNMVIVEEKYFWKMYQFPSAKNSAINQNATSSTGTPGTALSRPAMELNQRTHTRSFSHSQAPKEAPESARAPKSPKSTFKSGSREPIIKAKVEQYIEMPASSIGIIEEQKYAFYRDIQLIYYVQTCELVMISEEDGRSFTHVLQELTEEENMMLKLQFKEDQEFCFIKFKAKKQYENFVNGIFSTSSSQIKTQ